MYKYCAYNLVLFTYAPLTSYQILLHYRFYAIKTLYRFILNKTPLFFHNTKHKEDSTPK